MNTLLARLNSIGSSFVYWFLLMLFGISQIALALFYQYHLGYDPCVLCIHVRIWVSGLILVAIVAQWLRRNRWLNVLAHLATAGVMAGVFERGWQLLGTERGTIFGSCNFDAGLPGWFALDKWFPSLFEVRTSCGYTPELLFGITMAEALVVLSATLALIAAIFTIATIINRK